MKKYTLIAVFALLALSSCQKGGVDLFRGDYSFKTSGDVTATYASVSDPAEITVTLDNEIGQLQIASMNGKSDSLMVVMNYMNGEVVVTQACCKDQNIVFRDFRHNFLKFSMDGNIDMQCEVNVKASGTMYDGNTLILDMVYDGEAAVGPLKYNLHGDEIRMVATRN